LHEHLDLNITVTAQTAECCQAAMLSVEINVSVVWADRSANCEISLFGAIRLIVNIVLLRLLQMEY